MTHNELAARIERAEGPDRALDAEIAVAVYGGEIVWKMTNYTMESYPARRYASAQHVGGYGNDHVPEYTASIDAAMQLVPSGWKLRQMHFNAPCADDRKWHLNLRGGKEGGDRFVGRGSTPALALSAAALRARSAS